MRGIFRIESWVEMGILALNAPKIILEGMPKMKVKSNVLVYLLIIVSLVLQVLPVSAQGETPPLIEITISDEPSHGDENWPVIKNETHQRKDPSTGRDIIETTVVRRMPPTKENISCEKNLKTVEVNLIR